MKHCKQTWKSLGLSFSSKANIFGEPGKECVKTREIFVDEMYIKKFIYYNSVEEIEDARTDFMNLNILNSKFFLEVSLQYFSQT